MAMRKARSGFVEEIVLGPVDRVVERIPDTVRFGGFVVHLGEEVQKVPWVGRVASWRCLGTWELDRFGGDMWVDVLPAAGGMSLLTVSLRPPEGWRGRLMATEELQAAATEVAVHLSAAVEAADAPSDAVAGEEEQPLVASAARAG